MISSRYSAIWLGLLLLVPAFSSCDGENGENGEKPEEEVTCPDGSEGCPCYANGTCDSVDGVPMSCVDNVCVVESCEPGTLNCECGTGCADGLICSDDVCVEESCEPGTLNCECGTGCADGLICSDDVCVEESCEPGTLGCECGSGCAAGLTCREGSEESVCVPEAGVTIEVVAESVRGCDIVIEGIPGAVEVVFGQGVIGEYAVRGDRMAVSFIAREDGAIGGFPVLIDFETAGSPTSIGGECFDRLGKTVTQEAFTVY